METISIYIHIPLCVKKCAYCDFASFAGRMAHRDRYVQAVCREIRAQAAFFGQRCIGTIFFGGGTPTLLAGSHVQMIMDTVRTCFDVMDDAEISMEGNPGTLTMEKLRAYRAAGVNRLSAIFLSPFNLNLYVLDVYNPLFSRTAPCHSFPKARNCSARYSPTPSPMESRVRESLAEDAAI